MQGEINLPVGYVTLLYNVGYIIFNQTSLFAGRSMIFNIKMAVLGISFIQVT